MAASGSLNTNDYNGRYLTLSWTETAQSIADNTTTISWTLTGQGTSGNNYYTVQNITVVINGTTVYDYPKSEGQKKLYSGVTTISSGSMTITHDSDGSKSFAASVSAGIYYWEPNCSGSATFTLPQIARVSTLTASNGTLGTTQTLSVVRKAGNLTHTIAYECGSATGTICTKSSSTSISWTPPLALASQNTTGLNVSIKLTITTYINDSDVGCSTTSITCGIPSDVVPVVGFTMTPIPYITDGYSESDWNELGDQILVQNLTKFTITVNATGPYGAEITKYSTTFEGKTYSGETNIIDAPTKSGDLSIVVKVTDSRGRTSTRESTLSVYPYDRPYISKLLAYRHAYGSLTEDPNGSYALVIPTVVIPALTNTECPFYNAGKSYVEAYYKKTTESTWTLLTTCSNIGRVNSDTIYLHDWDFAADTGTSYDIKVEASDWLNTTTVTTRIGTGFVLMDWNAAGNGMGVGKRSEIENVLDIGLKTKFTGGIMPVTLDSGIDLDTLIIPGFYVSKTIGSNTYTNCPISFGSFSLEILAYDTTGLVIQRLTALTGKTYERANTGQSWEDWAIVSSRAYTSLPVYSSTEEQAIGTWIDGRTVYRKILSWNANPLASNKWTYYKENDLAALNIDYYINLFGFCQCYSENAATTALWQPIPRICPDANADYSIGIGDLSGTNIGILFGVKYTGATNIYLTIEYVKKNS